MAKKKPTFRTVRLRVETCDKIQQAIDALIRNGWKSIGTNKTPSGPPTIAGVVDLAVTDFLRDRVR